MLMSAIESPANSEPKQPSYLLLLITVIAMALVSAFLGLGLGLVIETESFRELAGSADFFVFLIFALAVWGVNYIALESVTTSGGKQLTFFSFLLTLIAITAFGVQLEVMVKPVLYWYGSIAVLFTAFMYGMRALMGESS